MRDLNYQVRCICRHNMDGARSTQETRNKHLELIANDIHSLGFKNIKYPRNLKAKHVYALVAKWSDPSNPVGVGTINNRLAALRWLAKKCVNPKLVHPENDHYVIVGSPLGSADYTVRKMTDQRARFSAQLQMHFGLAAEEAIKFNVSYAYMRTHIELNPSWCKGKGREIPITTDAQAELVAAIESTVGHGSLIPASMRYIQQLRVFEKQLKSVGLSMPHGLRYVYAQSRYEALTSELLSHETGELTAGLVCAAQGGFKAKDLTRPERQVDIEARKILSCELGHSGEHKLSVFLDSKIERSGRP